MQSFLHLASEDWDKGQLQSLLYLTPRTHLVTHRRESCQRNCYQPGAMLGPGLPCGFGFSIRTRGGLSSFLSFEACRVRALDNSDMRIMRFGEA